MEKIFDISETQIYICNTTFLDLFENECDTIEQFLKKQISINKSTILLDILDRNSFGAHFSLIYDLNSYFNECMKLLTRADLIPESYMIKYIRDIERLNCFINLTSVIGERSRLGRNVLIDSGCKIGNDCELENCWLGKNCHLGSNVKITNSIVGSNSKIGSNSSLNACIIGFNVSLGYSVKICENCVLADKIQVYL